MHTLRFNLLFTLFAFFIINLRAQKPIDNKNLSFLMGQNNIAVEFVYDKLTINEIPEAVFLKEQVEKMNKRHEGEGDAFLNYWENEKLNHIPKSFLATFNRYLNRFNFKAELESDAKYICVIHLMSIKTGIKTLTFPTLWLSYSFYEKNNRDKLLAFFMSHIAYAKGGSSTNLQGITTYTNSGTWDLAYAAYDKDGIALAKKIKKQAKLKR